MNCCTILIKIKDFIPKLSKIPYENFICIFTNDVFEGRISLLQYEYQHVNHEIKDIKSDIIYKIKVIDILSKKIIGISEHCIKYDIINKLDIGTSINFINQIRFVPNQKNKEKISRDTNYYNKLSLTISTEIIKFNRTPINYILKENSEFLKLNLKLPNKLNNKKNISIKSEDKNYYNDKMRKINTTMNKSKNKINFSLNEEKKDMNKICHKRTKGDLFEENDKNKINLNMHNITVQNYYTINSAAPLNINSVKNKKIYIKKYFTKNNKNKLIRMEENNNIIKQNEINYNNIKSKKEYENSTKGQKETYDFNNSNIDYFSSYEITDKNNLTTKSIKVGRKRIFRIKNKQKKYNNNSFKVINYSGMKNSVSFDNIKINKNKDRFINTSIKKNNSNNKIISDRINTLEISSYNITYSSNTLKQVQKYSKRLDSMISPKNKTFRENSIKSLKHNFEPNCNLKTRLRINKSKDNVKVHKNIHMINLKDKNNNYLFQKNNCYRRECKNNLISLFKFYILLNKKLKKSYESYNSNKSKYFLEKENLLNLIEKKNIIEQKKYDNKTKRYIYVNINSKINNQIISKMKTIKDKELNIFKNIFNTSINKEDMLDQVYKDNILKEEKKNEFILYLDLLKNIIKYYGNVSKIYDGNINKKFYLLHILINNGIEINNTEFLHKNNKTDFKEIKKELEEVIEEETYIDEEKESNDQNFISRTAIIDNININENILDKILIYEFPLKYGNITNKKFIKNKPNSNEYFFNNEIKIFAYYNKDEILLKLENKEYSLDEFINNFIKNKKENSSGKRKKNSNYNNIINIQKNKLKKNISWKRFSRNQKNKNDIAFKGDLKKKLINAKLLSNDIINKNINKLKKK